MTSDNSRESRQQSKEPGLPGRVNPSGRQDGTAGSQPTPAPTTRPSDAAASSDAAHQSTGATTEKASAKSTKPAIETIEALVTEAFESNGYVLAFGPDRLKKLPVSDDHLPAQVEMVIALSKADPALNGPFKLLQYVASRGVRLGQSSGSPLEGVLERLRDLAMASLSYHPVFRVWIEELRDPRRDPQLTIGVLMDEVSKVDAGTFKLTEDQFKESDKARLLRNTIACFSLVRVLQREWDFDRFIDEAEASLWSADMPKAIGPEKAAALLSASREGNLFGLIADAYESRINARDQEIRQLRSESAKAARRIELLEEQQREADARERALSARVDEYSADVVRLRKDLNSERDNRVVDKSHATDDYETLRTRVIRRLTGEIDLLTDALHAVRNGASPVAEEFLDRSLLALSREVEQLKEAAGGLA